jgi:cytochrome c peroxidase
LEEAVEHYCTRVVRNAALDPNLAKHPDGGIPLTEPDKKSLVAFLKTLTDSTYEKDVSVQESPPTASHRVTAALTKE